MKKLLDSSDEIEYMAEPKLDGVGVELIYENGIFTMESKAIKLLSTYSWKGNVRELRNVVERLTILSENNDITSDDVKKFSGKK